MRYFNYLRYVNLITAIIDGACRSARRIVVDPAPTVTPSRSARGSEIDLDESPSPGFKVNKAGLTCLKNGAVALKQLDLARSIPSKVRSPSADRLFGNLMTWGEAFSFFCLVKCGRYLPVEKHREHDLRLQVMRSAFQYALDDFQQSLIMQEEPEALCAYLLGMERAAQQKLRYSLYGAGAGCAASNHFNENVFLRSGSGLRPSEEVQKHLGLVGPHANKTFMDM